MFHPGQLPKLLLALLIVAVTSGCASHDQDPRQSLRVTKQRLDEAKKDKDLRGESAQLLYEADLYWQRAWAARDDAANAHHLLFMAQGKLALAQSTAALRDAERKLKTAQSAQATRNSTQALRRTPGNRNGQRPVSASARERTTAARSDGTGSEARNTTVATRAPQAIEAPGVPITGSVSSEKAGVERAAAEIKPKDSDDSPAESPAQGTETIARKDPVMDTPAENAGSTADRSNHEDEVATRSTSTTVVSADRVSNDGAPRQPEAPVSMKEPAESKTAALTKEDGAVEPAPAEGAEPTKRPNANEPERAASTAPVKPSRETASTEFNVNIPTYCRSIASMVRGNRDVEQKCRELELSSQKRLKSLKSNTLAYESIYKYCSNVARALGSGYQIMELCVDQELGVRPDTPSSPQGYVMEEPGSTAKKSAGDRGSVSGN